MLQKFENRLIIKKFCPKTILNMDYHGSLREITIFPQNLKICSILSKSLEIIIKCHKILTLDQIIVFKSRILLEMKIYDYGLKTLSLTVFQNFAGPIGTN